ncbi:MAG: STAS domain-containing protein [Planctomycetaceae bacterium]
MTAETTCRFEEIDHDVLAVVLRPELNEIPWTDIERIGSGIVRRVESRPMPRILVDMAELDHMGSAMVALVVRIWKAVSEKQGRMIVVNRNAVVGEVLEISGLASKWTIVPTREEALAAVGAGGGTPSSVIGGETRTGVVLTLLSGVFLLLAVLGLADALSDGLVAGSLGRAATFWLGVGCAILAVVLGVVAVIRTFGTLKIVAAVLTTLSVVTALASVLFVG